MVKWPPSRTITGAWDVFWGVEIPRDWWPDVFGGYHFLFSICLFVSHLKRGHHDDDDDDDDGGGDDGDGDGDDDDDDEEEDDDDDDDDDVDDDDDDDFFLEYNYLDMLHEFMSDLVDGVWTVSEHSTAESTG